MPGRGLRGVLRPHPVMKNLCSHRTHAEAPYILWAQRGPRLPAGQMQEPVTASQVAPAEQLQAWAQSNPKKPAGQAADKSSIDKRLRGQRTLPCTQLTMPTP